MMDKKIRRLIDDIFSDMKMTADNLALRDEMMANAQARYEDSVRQGKTEEEAFAEVAASLGDVQSLLKEMNAQDGGEQDVPNASEEPKAEETEEPKDAEANTEMCPTSAKRWARRSAHWATWASRSCRRRRSWSSRWTA